MTLGWRQVLALALALVLLPAVARAEVEVASRLALPVVAGSGGADGPLAQRVIDREWGPSEDSTYRVVNVPGWQSEGLALTLSGVLPGAGQLYDGESSGWLYVLTEAAGWTGYWLSHRKAESELASAERFVGNPYDSTAGFSFARYVQYTGSDPATLAALWAGDRNAFYRALQRDPVYLHGFAGGRPEDAYGTFNDLLDSHDNSLHRVHLLATLLLVNHLVAAADALRAARVHNAPLREEYHLELGERWQRGAPAMRAAIVRRF
jgi:hypothetical protein